MKTGIELIAEERERQIAKENWTSDHDAKHSSGELAAAAACYAVGEPIYRERRLTVGGSDRLPVIHFENVWPFESGWYKPKKNEIRNLARAGALIAAEIDRLQHDVSSI